MTDERARAGKLFASGAVPGASFLFDALRREAEQHLDKAQTAASVASKAAKKAAKDQAHKEGKAVSAKDKEREARNVQYVTLFVI